MPITINGTGSITGVSATGISSVQNVPATSVITTLNAPSGVLATQNGMTGIAKAWVNYNGVAQTITGSFNVSSVTRNGTGIYTVNYTTAMPNANYATAITGRRNATNSYIGYALTYNGTYTASAVQIDMWGEAGYGYEDMNIVCVTVFSS